MSKAANKYPPEVSKWALTRPNIRYAGRMTTLRRRCIDPPISKAVCEIRALFRGRSGL